MTKPFKFKVGQVVFNKENNVFVLITKKYRDDEGTRFYTLAWQEDLDYDEATEDQLRSLKKKEIGNLRT